MTIVGGGSYQWGPELMADLFGTPALAGMHLVLEDIDPAPLPNMEALASELVDTRGLWSDGTPPKVLWQRAAARSFGRPQ